MAARSFTRVRVTASIGLALLAAGMWVSVSGARRQSGGPPQAAENAPQIVSDRPRAAPQGGNVTSFRAEIRRDAQKGWETLIADTSWNNLQKIAAYMAVWIDEDPNAAIEAFGTLARDHPNLVGDIAVFCGDQWSGKGWAAVEARAKERLNGFELKAFILVVARGAVESDPSSALRILDNLGDPVVGDLLSAQRHVRGFVVEASVKRDFGMTLEWLEKHRSWSDEWRSFCRACAEGGVDRIAGADLTRVLSNVPLPNGPALEGFMVLGKGQNREAAFKLVRAMDSVDTSGEMEQARSGLISVLAEHTPEIFDSSYFNANNASDAVAVGMARKGSFKDSLEWAETLRTTGAEAPAIKGIVYQMMHANSYMGSREIGNLDDASPQKAIAISTMIEWLRSRGKTGDAEIWQKHLDGLKRPE
ncbi:MAG: hypothetical protein J0M04_21420 [Verrucomicrobia bacterium]|nr:hypothetical protein [Verrucomicrobiota bacterium]